ncbi:MAG: UvrD-helicase domain-containing protein, partial [Cetobacterium sp.]
MKGVVLKASAGTGKTYRLSLEYLATLFKGENYKDILVMTFTKKATAEIKDRVLIFLEEMYKNSESGLYENLEKLHPDLDLSFENVRKVYYEVLDNKDRLKISTIDGFINNIFKNVIAPYLNIFFYEIIDDSENQEILLKAFQKIVAEKEQFDKFKIFLENRTERDIEKYLDILKKLIQNRWKVTLINQSKIIKKKEIYEENIAIDKLTSHLIDAFNIVKEKKADGKDIESYMSKAIKWILESDISHKDYAIENWSEILKAEKCWDGRRVRTTKAKDFDSEIDILTKAFNELKEEISKEVFNKDVLEFEKEILNFIENLYEVYDTIKFTEKRFTHLDISSYMFKYINESDINLIDNGVITQYFKDIFDSEFKTVFIDEFQDTSVLQWRILKGLIDSCENLICVGDEKQSIYGWRGGEKSLFENLHHIIGVKEETMSTSYRSCKNIVDFTNKVFKGVSEAYSEEVNLENSDSEWKFSPVDGKSDELGYFEVIRKTEFVPNDEIDEVVDETLKSEEIEEDMLQTMVDSIEDNFKDDYSGIGIIARNNKQLNEIAFALNERKIPYVIESNDSIIYHRAVNPIFKFLKYCINKDIFSLLEFLRSDIVKIGNYELKFILKEKEYINNYIFPTILSEEAEILNEKQDFDLGALENVFQKIKSVLNTGLENKNFVLNIIKEFNLTTFYSGTSDLKNVFQFLEMSKNYENIFEFYNSLIKEKDNPKFK